MNFKIKGTGLKICNQVTSAPDERQASRSNNNNRDRGNNEGGKHLPKQPLVARISLWTTRPNGRLTKIDSQDSGNDSNDDDDRHNRNNDDDNHDKDHYDDDDDDDEDEYFDIDMDENAQLEQRLKQANLPEQVRKVAAKEMQKLRRTPNFMSDHAATRGYLELLAELPWNESTQELIDLKKCRRDLDNDHYGMLKLKERVLQYLAVIKLKQQLGPVSISSSNSIRNSIDRHQGEKNSATPTAVRRSTQPILMFVGPPGTGKTSIAQSIASSLGRKFQRISLGGIADQSAIRGHRRTYIGSMPGRIVQGIKQVGVNNPVFLLDEVDKMGVGPQGDPSSALLEVLDPEQNHTFTDHYLNVPFDLSRVLFIATANSLDMIPPALLDRMEVIQVAGYTHEEKFNIARRHLVPKQVIDNGLKPNMIVFKDDAIHKIISNYAREAGVRALERRIATICRIVAVRVVEAQQGSPNQGDNGKPDTSSPGGRSAAAMINKSFPTVVIDAASLENYLGPVVYDRETNGRPNVPGVAIGLAWTAAGGEITFVEAEILQGSKKEGLILTGQLGSVMRESAMLALNWIRANFHRYEALPKSLGRDLVDNTIHVHFPAGAVGKDGPSAGVTIVTALLSLCSNMSVVPDLAMTGEITLRGVVLKVGGVKSKVLAAHRAGIKRIILPARNEPDLGDIPVSIREKVKFHFVSTIEEVIQLAFEGKLAPKSHFTTAGLTSKL